jgi:sec-independent protein translocase protein TatB
VFDLSITKLLVLAVIALIVFGPNELPKVASQAGRVLRDLRRIAEGAKNDLREGLGPEFQDFDFEDLNPRRFVQKHIFEDGAGNNGAQALFDDLKSTSATISNGINDALNGGRVPAAAAAGAMAPAVGPVAPAANGADPTVAARAVLPDGAEPPFDLEAT